jgi:hypothetical protein
VLSNAPRDQMDEVAVSDGADGAIIAWRDGRNTATGTDVYAVRLLSTGAVAAGWTAGGTAIAVLGGGQSAPSMVSDDAGGAWIAWVDERNLVLGGTDIYLTHVLANATLAAGFVANGRALCDQPGDQSAVQLARDGSGGCFAVWLDARDGEVAQAGEQERVDRQTHRLARADAAEHEANPAVDRLLSRQLTARRE